MENKISIIVPVYNVEQYLPRCIDSILKQTYPNLEIIMVDDGSTDKSGDVADELAASDARIVVIHKKNGGLSSARNVGIDNSSGEFLMFVDSDDFIAPDMCKIMMSEAIKNGSDMVECGMIKVFGDHEESDKNRRPTICTGKEALKFFLKPGSIFKPVAWDALYRKEIFRDIRFEEGRLHEDGWFKYKAFYNSKQISVIGDCLYYYVQSREGSIMTVKLRPKNIRDLLDAFENRWLFFKKKNEEELADLAKAAYCRELLSYYYVVNGALEDKKAVKDFSNEIKDKLLDFKSYILNCKSLRERRIKFLVFYYLRGLSTLLSNFRNWN